MTSLNGIGRYVRSLAALGVLLFSLGAFAQTRRAVIIGIDKYSPPEGTKAAAAAPPPAEISVSTHAAKRDLTDDANLNGAVNDALAMAQVLQLRYDFKPENIHYLLSVKPDYPGTLPPHEEPTGANILAAIQKHLIDEAQPGDILVFYYAGHGSQVYNSLSNKPTKLDETIVPADAFRGTLDIRDKQISRIFNQVLGGLDGKPDKHVIFTAIFDSCHSGSIGRGFQIRPGKMRFLGPDLSYDAKDKPDPGPPPEERGALIISSAQDTEPAAEATDDKGNDHGAFTLGLLQALRTMPVSAPAKDVFLSARSLLKSLPQNQEPVLAGTEERKRQPMFGGEAGGVTGKITVTVQSVDEDGNVKLVGGQALGLAPKCEFVPAEVPKTRGAEAAAGPHLEIVSVDGLTTSTAKVVGGKATDIQVGQRFVLDRWVASSGALLRVWVPPSQLSDAEVRAAAAEFLKLGDRVQWVDDPTATSPTHIIEWNGAEWTLSTNGTPRSLGRNPTAQEIAQKLGPPDPKKPVKLFLSLPPTAELAAALKAAIDEGRAITIAKLPRQATYVLMGHVSQKAGNALEYAWVLPNTVKEVKYVPPRPGQRHSADQGPPSPPVLPVRTDWIASGSNPEEARRAADRLHDFAFRIERIQGWLQLPSPPNENSFPYRLELRYVGQAVNDRCPVQEVASKVVRSGDTVEAGECYQMYLSLTQPKRIASAIDKRWVYVFSIDSDGTSNLYYPDLRHGNVGNKQPEPAFGQEDKPLLEIPVGPRIHIIPPVGIDTYVMLTTDEPIDDPSVFQAKGVRTRAVTFRKPAKNPLENLLRRVGDNTRGGAAESTPANWSVQRISIKSVDKGQGK